MPHEQEDFLWGGKNLESFSQKKKNPFLWEWCWSLGHSFPNEQWVQVGFREQTFWVTPLEKTAFFFLIKYEYNVLETHLYLW